MNKILGFTNLLPFVNNYYSGMATIFMLHRVNHIDSNKLSPNERMKISPEYLDTLITNLIKEGYEIISLDRLNEVLRKELKVKKQIVFTLDDGYKDNFDIAYPIFKKHNTPFTVYVTTSMPEKKTLLWWYVLEDLILSHDEIILSNNKKYSCKTNLQKLNTFFKIRELIISFEPEDFELRLKNLFNQYKIDWYSKCEELALSWDEIKILASDPLVTISGHTVNHYALNRLDEDEVIKEISTANKLLKDKINIEVEHFAYPFGSDFEIGQREFNLVKNMGFKTATTTRTGNIYPAHKNYLECLPRIMLTEDFSIRNIGNFRMKKIVTI